MQTKSGKSKSSEIIADGFRYGKKVGTIEKGASLEVLLFIPRKETAMEVYACIRKDYEDSVERIHMTRTGWKADLDLYTCELPTGRIGLFWYWFELQTGHGYGMKYSHAENGRVSFAFDYESMQPLQLTVYERQYEVPAFLQGGIIYQVFIDRFRRGSSSRPMEEICREDPVKSRYRIRKKDETYDNHSERSIILRDDWGGEPLWQADAHGEILNNDFFGGNLAGIREKLPYFQSLGVTCLYLNPIFEAYSNHRYDTGDYLKIDPLIGDEEEFRLLCEEAKTYGISVMLDGVFNHTGDDSRYFNRYGTYDACGAWGNEQSPYRSWYAWTGYDTFGSWWGIRTMPTMNKDAAGYRALLFGEEGVIRKWIGLGAAGWRLDVVDELPTSFLRPLVRAAKSEREDAVVLGEVWEDASNKIAYDFRRSYFQGEELDSVMNYPWKNAILSYLRDGNARGLGDTVTEICTNYPPEVLSCLMNPLSTHDSVRALTVLAGRKPETDTRAEKAALCLTPEEAAHGKRLLKLAVLIQMLLPGVPSIYYGDEAGMEGYNDPFNRRCYPWGQEDQDMISWFCAMGELRGSQRAFFAGADCDVLSVADGVFAFRRSCGDRRMVCIVNRGRDPLVTMATGGFEIDPMVFPETDRSFRGSVSRTGNVKRICVPARYGYLILWGGADDKVDLMFED